MKNSSINKALDILDFLLENKEEINVRTLSEKTGIKISNLYQIISVLMARKYLYMVSRGKYNIGAKFINLGIDSTSDQLKEKAYPYLKNLTNEAGENSNLTIYSNGSIVDLLLIMADYRLQIQIRRRQGEFTPLHATSIGKCILAYLPSQEYDKLAKNMILSACTENTITDDSKFKGELQKVKDEGIAFDYEEYELGLRGMSAPVMSKTCNIIGSCGIYGPSFRLTRIRMQELVPVVKNCAREISTAIS